MSGGSLSLRMAGEANPSRDRAQVNYCQAHATSRKLSSG
ncbi:Large exoprotein involved in heme utilization or adhesion [Pseudomonas syringae pv. actinidiae]|uniref:Large exoprotein involved in heme utilization or adhesion n=1 Tax=Pseudomonas syringae pv. actinidiae TaxID=103796 RepID=A0A2V0QAP7_PSESF|nr:Large exoprotein involved in heme utilization or adhesion [Pseudomonas syringae pv. actinidiae]